MRNQLVILALCLFAIVVGVVLYFGTPHSRPVTGSGTLPAVPANQAVTFSVLDEGTTASITDRKNYAIYDPGEFATFWQKTHPGKTKPPTIDFNTDYVIAVFAGTEPTMGYSIHVSKVTDNGNTRAVAVTLEKPGQGCTPKIATSTPYQFVVVPFGNANALTHTDTEAAKDCK